MQFFADQEVPVEAVAKEDYDLWLPAECPHCQSGVKLEDVAV